MEVTFHEVCLALNESLLCWQICVASYAQVDLYDENDTEQENSNLLSRSIKSMSA
jgi:hypothetical protein